MQCLAKSLVDAGMLDHPFFAGGIAEIEMQPQKLPCSGLRIPQPRGRGIRIDRSGVRIAAEQKTPNQA